MAVEISVVVCLAALAGLLVAEYRDVRPGIWFAKPLAASAYIALALAAGALASTYGQLVLAALVLCWFGDVLLIPAERPQIFRAGAASFLLGHVAFVAAFLSRGLDTAVAMGAALVLAVAAFLALRWLGPSLPPGMIALVRAYVAVISVMAATAMGAANATGDSRIAAGALLFFLSDLSVARDRFVEKAFLNRAWGLPFYFVGQLLLASTV